MQQIKQEGDEQVFSMYCFEQENKLRLIKPTDLIAAYHIQCVHKRIFVVAYSSNKTILEETM